MTAQYTFVLVHKGLDRDNIYIRFKCSDFLVKMAFFALSLALVSSPYCELLLHDGDKIILRSDLSGEF